MCLEGLTFHPGFPPREDAHRRRELAPECPLSLLKIMEPFPAVCPHYQNQPAEFSEFAFMEEQSGTALAALLSHLSGCFWEEVGRGLLHGALKWTVRGTQRIWGEAPALRTAGSPQNPHPRFAFSEMIFPGEVELARSFANSL